MTSYLDMLWGIDAIRMYTRSLKILNGKSAVLANIAYASSILSQDSPAKDEIDIAISSLQKAKIYEPDNIFLYNRLALAYFKKEQRSKYYIALLSSIF